MPPGIVCPSPKRLISLPLAYNFSKIFDQPIENPEALNKPEDSVTIHPSQYKNTNGFQILSENQILENEEEEKKLALSMIMQYRLSKIKNTDEENAKAKVFY